MRTVSEIMEWWEEYGFTRDNYENSDTIPLFDEFLDLISELSLDDQCGVLTWMMRR